MFKFLKGLTMALLLFVLSTTSVSANSGPPIIGITIVPDICEEVYSEESQDSEAVFPNNIDILVQTNDFEEDDFISMTNHYKETYPFFEDIDYLDELEPGWTSFSAFYKDDYEWGYGFHYCSMQFGDHSIVSQIEKIKIVYFDDNGTTLFISEEILIPDVLFYQDRDSVIEFNTATYSVDQTQLEPSFDFFTVIEFMLLLLLIAYSVTIEVVVALFFKFKSKKYLYNIIFINVVTQGAMYLYFLVIYNPHGNSYMEHLFFYEIIVLIVEFLYLHFRFKSMVSWKRLILYVFISNIVSYLLGILRYL